MAITTKTKIINLAEELIRTRGYTAFSYKDIATVLKVKNAAIHYHFPSKEQLGRAVLERRRRQFKEATASWASLPYLEQLQRLMNVYKKSQQQQWVCLVGALGPAYPVLPTSMQTSLTQMTLDIKTWTMALLEEGKAAQVFNFKETIEEKSLMIVTSLLSSLIISRVMQPNSTDIVIEGLLKSI
ncbi:MAG: TetR/AcrR family transcriptional regulator [Aureispira sp.]